eukprot:8220189-Ditylum_brightwellii.AAC.1
MKALVITCSKDKSWEMKNVLYKMNNESTCKKQCWDQTGNWFLVSFGEDGPISLAHIANMIQCQNIYIRGAVNITVS